MRMPETLVSRDLGIGMFPELVTTSIRNSTRRETRDLVVTTFLGLSRALGLSPSIPKPEESA